jgi:hypothetical protein
MDERAGEHQMPEELRRLDPDGSEAQQKSQIPTRSCIRQDEFSAPVH